MKRSIWSGGGAKRRCSKDPLPYIYGIYISYCSRHWFFHLGIKNIVELWNLKLSIWIAQWYWTNLPIFWNIMYWRWSEILSWRHVTHLKTSSGHVTEPKSGMLIIALELAIFGHIQDIASNFNIKMNC